MIVRELPIVAILAGGLSISLTACSPPSSEDASQALTTERIVVKIDEGPYIGVSRESMAALHAYRSGKTTRVPRFGLGRPAQDSEIAAWDVDIMPDGHGLPEGSGTAATGARVYAQRCAVCHGTNGEGIPPNGALSASESTGKTIGSHWPYATTVFDYVRQAMPFNAPGSLTNDEVYALTAYLLNMNGIIRTDDVINATNLPKVEMPNADGFVADDRENSNLIH